MHIFSPCLGVCSTTCGDFVCRGCMRHNDTIVQWPGLSQQQKIEKIGELDAIINKVMPNAFIIEDSEKLVFTMQKASIPIDPIRSPYAWLHKYLMRTATTISNDSLASAGVVLRKPGKIYALFEQCRDEMYSIAIEHFQ